MTEREVKLWEELKVGGQEALENLILHYLPLVKLWVGRVSRVIDWASWEDLTQEGVIGLMEAIENFTFDGRREFAPYAYKFIRGAILRNSDVARGLTRYRYEHYREVCKTSATLAEKLGREPTIEEIADEAKLKPKQVKHALDATHIAFAKACFEFGQESSPDDWSANRQYEIILIEEAVSQLGEEEAQIIKLYYWRGHTDREIAEKLGIKEYTIKQKRRRALEKLASMV